MRLHNNYCKKFQICYILTYFLFGLGNLAVSDEPKIANSPALCCKSAFLGHFLTSLFHQRMTIFKK